MPHTTHNIALQEDDKTVRFRYECWSNGQGDGIITVAGQTSEDHLHLINNRRDVSDALKQEEGLKNVRYFEDQGNGRHTEIKLEVNEQERVTQAVNTHSSLSTMELSNQGQDLLDQEHDHNVTLSQQEFGEQSKSVKDSPQP